ncbi:MAG: ribbon-helix-helix domain-containing protein [Acidobacteria bacterium]|nr:ribbon-helix-helix domain-containing protein [Acidobacteriota bacterium]MCL5289107.1 ribbon-helix-helix domain-containing protein [Acidobacteriota bacterium]
MKITVYLRKEMIARLKREAARQGRTMSELVELALQSMFEQQRQPPKRLPKLPRFHMGRALVDVADRDALYDAMDDLKLYRND